MKNKRGYSSRTCLWILPILLFCCGNIFSQETKSGAVTPFAVSLSYCGSIPVGAFASQNTQFSNSGFSKIGGTMRFTVDYNIHQNWGIVFNYDRVSLPLNSSSIIRSFNQSFPGYTVNNSSTGWWIINNYQVGIANIYIVKNKDQKIKMLIENRCMMGIASINSPEISVASSNTGSALLFNQSSKNTAAFSLAIGGTIKSNPQRHLFMKASLDLCMSSGRFNNIEVTKNENGVITNSSKNITQPISYISIGWGVGWRF